MKKFLILYKYQKNMLILIPLFLIWLELLGTSIYYIYTLFTEEYESDLVKSFVIYAITMKLKVFAYIARHLKKNRLDPSLIGEFKKIMIIHTITTFIPITCIWITNQTYLVLFMEFLIGLIHLPFIVYSQFIPKIL